MTAARKDYKCDLCGEVIPKGTDYHREDVTPWNCSPDGDKGYFTFHTHHECMTIWLVMRGDDEDELPPADVWEQMVAEYQQRKEKTPVEVA